MSAWANGPVQSCLLSLQNMVPEHHHMYLLELQNLRPHTRPTEILSVLSPGDLNHTLTFKKHCSNFVPTQPQISGLPSQGNGFFQPQCFESTSLMLCLAWTMFWISPKSFTLFCIRRQFLCWKQRPSLTQFTPNWRPKCSLPSAASHSAWPASPLPSPVMPPDDAAQPPSSQPKGKQAALSPSNTAMEHPLGLPQPMTMEWLVHQADQGTSLPTKPQ